LKRLNGKFYDKEYFTGRSKSEYGVKAHGGYDNEIYKLMKYEQAGYFLKLAGYTKRWLPDNAIVLGCAYGFMVQGLNESAKVPTKGIDISEFAIDHGTKMGIKNLEVGDTCKLLAKDNEYEFVISLNLLENIPIENDQLLNAIKEHVRICNGYIIMGVKLGHNDNLHDQHKGINKSHFSVYTPSWWQTEFEKLGAKTITSVVDEAKENIIYVFEVS